MVEVVGILARVRKHEGRLQRAVEIGETEQLVIAQCKRVVAEIPELDVRSAKRRSCLLGLRTA